MKIDSETKQAIERDLSKAAGKIVAAMLDHLCRVPFGDRYPVLLGMLADPTMMDGHKAEIESFLKRRYYWQQ